MRIFCALVFSSFLIVCPSSTAQSQTATNELEPGYYVVVAAFSPNREALAKRYVAKLGQQGLKAAYGFYAVRKYYYVYLKYFPDNFQESVREMRTTRKELKFSDAWVSVIGESAKALAAVQPSPVEKKPEPEKPAEQMVTPATPAVTETQAPPQEKTEEPVAEGDTSEITENPPIVQFEKMTLENTEVFLSLFNARNNRIVEGKVKVVDTEKSKLIKEVDGNDYMFLPDPRNVSGQITLICEAFGYRKVQHEINYPLPLADTVKDYVDLMGTTFIVYFDLVRYHKGDVATLYHVYFFNDAALMLPESKFELNTLLQMMQEDPNYRVRLHGHTNGNYHGKIIKMGSEKNFFSLDGSTKTTGSAKDLSRARAEVIKEYLVTNGIDPARIEVKAWGGKRPIYDRHGANAKKNVRVEVEILDE